MSTPRQPNSRTTIPSLDDSVNDYITETEDDLDEIETQFKARILSDDSYPRDIDQMKICVDSIRNLFSALGFIDDFLAESQTSTPEMLSETYPVQLVFYISPLENLLNANCIQSRNAILHLQFTLIGWLWGISPAYSPFSQALFLTHSIISHDSFLAWPKDHPSSGSSEMLMSGPRPDSIDFPDFLFALSAALSRFDSEEQYADARRLLHSLNLSTKIQITSEDNFEVNEANLTDDFHQRLDRFISLRTEQITHFLSRIQRATISLSEDLSQTSFNGNSNGTLQTNTSHDEILRTKRILQMKHLMQQYIYHFYAQYQALQDVDQYEAMFWDWLLSLDTSFGGVSGAQSQWRKYLSGQIKESQWIHLHGIQDLLNQTQNPLQRLILLSGLQIEDGGKQVDLEQMNDFGSSSLFSAILTIQQLILGKNNINSLNNANTLPASNDDTYEETLHDLTAELPSVLRDLTFFK